PDLLTANWPQVLGMGPLPFLNAYPVADAAGNITLAQPGTQSVWLYSLLGARGHVFNLSPFDSDMTPPAAGHLAGTAGEQLAIGAGASVQLMTLQGSVSTLLTDSHPGLNMALAGALVADLDGDGKSEIIAAIQDTYSYQILVLMPDGSVKPGWPVTLYPSRLYFPFMAIGDLDQDGKQEIVFSCGSMLHVMRSNGTPFS